jgi:hypothetical protein
MTISHPLNSQAITHRNTGHVDTFHGLASFDGAAVQGRGVSDQPWRMGHRMAEPGRQPPSHPSLSKCQRSSLESARSPAQIEENL